MKKRFSIIIAMSIMLISSVHSFAQSSAITIKELPAINLKKHVPAGSYSGITYLTGNTYAVVSDKSDRDGFFKFSISLDNESGEIMTVDNLGFYGSQTANRDAEGIAYNSLRNTLYVGGEKNNTIVEYDLNGMATGIRSGNLFPTSRSNKGVESLCYDKKNNLIWCITESTLTDDNGGNYTTETNGVRNMLRLTALDTSFSKVKEYAYLMDSPDNMKQANTYAMGVSDIAVLDDGRILVLEREAFVPKLRFGAWCTCKIYIVDPKSSSLVESTISLNSSTHFMDKTLLWANTTRMSFEGLNWANFEGMCLGPRLKDGGQPIILISDSENRYKKVLQDWMKVLVIYY